MIIEPNQQKRSSTMEYIVMIMIDGQRRAVRETCNFGLFRWYNSCVVLTVYMQAWHDYFQLNDCLDSTFSSDACIPYYSPPRRRYFYEIVFLVVSSQFGSNLFSFRFCFVSRSKLNWRIHSTHMQARTCWRHTSQNQLCVSCTRPYLVHKANKFSLNFFFFLFGILGHSLIMK